VISKYARSRKLLKAYQLTPLELAWVAGLLEGEGCFTRKSGASSLRGVTVQCHMTDLDVLQRLHRTIGVGHLRGPYKASGPTGSRKKYKPRWMVQVSGPAAYQLMQQLLPLMCSRRAARIRVLLKEYESVKDHVFKMVHLKSRRVEETTDMVTWLKKHHMSNSGLYRTFIGERQTCYGWKRVA
jgi:hypothetical protein